MSANCEVCGYKKEMSEFLGNLTGEALLVVKELLVGHRGIVEGVVAGISNQLEFMCPQCEKFVHWVLAKVMSSKSLRTEYGIMSKYFSYLFMVCTILSSQILADSKEADSEKKEISESINKEGPSVLSDINPDLILCVVTHWRFVCCLIG